MSRGKKIALFTGSTILLLGTAAVLIVRTPWFRDQVRQRIVQEVENATGGRVEMPTFSFDWHTLQAKVTGFILHGTEPAGEAPLFQAQSIVVGLKIVSVFERKVDIALLEVNQPRIRVIEFPDGHTNLPEPKVKRKSRKEPLETVVDLAVRRFVIDHGTVEFDGRKTPLEAKGENLRALLLYEFTGPRYTGNISIQPLRVGSFDLDVKVPITIEKDRIAVSGSTIAMKNSRFEVSGDVRNMEAPRGSFQVKGRVAPADLRPDLKFADVNLTAAGSFEGNRLQVARGEAAGGGARVEFAGLLDDVKALKGAFHYDAQVALRDLGRTLKLSFLRAGAADLTGQARVNGSEDYSLDGNLRLAGAAFAKGAITVAGCDATGRVHLDRNKIRVTDLHASALGGDFTGTGTVQHFQDFQLEGDAHGMSAALLARTFARPQGNTAFEGFISGPVRGQGRITKSGVQAFEASADVSIAPATRKMPLAGKVSVTYNQTRNTVDLGNSFVTLPHSRIDFSGVLGSRMSLGLVSRDLAELLPLLDLVSSRAPTTLPVSLRNGTTVFEGSVSGALEHPLVSGHLAMTNVVFEDHTFAQVAADVSAEPSGVSLRNGSVTSGALSAQVTGSLGLSDWSPGSNQPLSLQASLQGMQLAEFVAPRPVTGTVAGVVQASGSLGAPQAKAEFTIAKGSAYGEPFDQAKATLEYTNDVLQLTSAQIDSGAARLNLTATYQHRLDDFEQGRLQFHITSNQVHLEKLSTAMKKQPGLTGPVQLTADGVVAIQGHEVRPVTLNASLTGTALRLHGESLGDVSLTAATKGQTLSFHLKSDFANANIVGEGETRMEGDYPTTARVTFAPLTYTSLRGWLMPSQAAAAPASFDAVAEGKLTITGPAMRPEALTGVVELSKLQIRALPGAEVPAEIALSNTQPVVLKLEQSVVHIENAHFSGKATDLTVSGTAALKRENPWNVHLAGVIGMEILTTFDPDILSDGSLALDANIRGKLANPEVNGRLELKNASFNLANFPNGLSHASGTIVFNGTSAVIQQITAETGGGKATITGFAGLAEGQLNFHLDARARAIRVRYPEGVSTIANANLSLTGTHNASLLSGAVSIQRVSFVPRTDFGAILARTFAPTPLRPAAGGFLAGMRLDVQIQTATNASFESAVSQGISANASLHVTGFANTPAMLGRIQVTQGQITFFGNNYTINQGSISFFNAVRMEPILNIDLETATQGIDVILTVSGPMRQLNISYRSDPPLPFSQIVGLLATGTAPTADPALVASQQASPQGFQQIGESALLANAIANPVASRLQKFFGITKLQIDPTISGVENSPLARVTLQQQITKSITFTYITDVRQSNPQVVRIEWALDPTWSAIATRDINGQFGLDFLYKRRFK